MELRTFLRTRGIDSQDFSDLLGINRSYLSSIANNKRSISFKLAKKIEKATKGQVCGAGLLVGAFKRRLKKSFPEYNL